MLLSRNDQVKFARNLADGCFAILSRRVVELFDSSSSIREAE